MDFKELSQQISTSTCFIATRELKQVCKTLGNISNSERTSLLSQINYKNLYIRRKYLHVNNTELAAFKQGIQLPDSNKYYSPVISCGGTTYSVNISLEKFKENYGSSKNSAKN